MDRIAHVSFSRNAIRCALNAANGLDELSGARSEER